MDIKKQPKNIYKNDSIRLQDSTASEGNCTATMEKIARDIHMWWFPYIITNGSSMQWIVNTSMKPRRLFICKTEDVQNCTLLIKIV